MSMKSMNSFALFNCRQLKSHGTQGDPAPRRHRQPGRPGAWAPTPDQLEAPRRWPKTAISPLRSNSHLLSTHRYQLKVASCIR
jgi:hypothetical protein